MQPNTLLLCTFFSDKTARKGDTGSYWLWPAGILASLAICIPGKLKENLLRFQHCKALYSNDAGANIEVEDKIDSRTMKAHFDCSLQLSPVGFSTRETGVGHFVGFMHVLLLVLAEEEEKGARPEPRVSSL